MIVCFQQHVCKKEMVLLFLAIQSFPHTDVTNKWGQTPVNVARSKGHNKVADYIINYAKGELQKPNESIILHNLHCL